MSYHDNILMRVPNDSAMRGQIAEIAARADAEIAALRADSARLDWLLAWLADPANCRNIRFDRAMIDAEREDGGNG